MLEVLKKSGITNTVVVVTRYFGGIKLGASGLIRAYSHSVSLGLEQASIADYLPYTVLTAVVAYSFVSTVERLVPSYNTARITDRAFAADVSFTIEVAREETDTFLEALTNATNGRAVCETQGVQVIPIVRKKE